MGLKKVFVVVAAVVLLGSSNVSADFFESFDGRPGAPFIFNNDFTWDAMPGESTGMSPGFATMATNDGGDNQQELNLVGGSPEFWDASSAGSYEVRAKVINHTAGLAAGHLEFKKAQFDNAWTLTWTTNAVYLENQFDFMDFDHRVDMDTTDDFHTYRVDWDPIEPSATLFVDDVDVGVSLPITPGDLKNSRGRTDLTLGDAFSGSSGGTIVFDHYSFTEVELPPPYRFTWKPIGMDSWNNQSNWDPGIGPPNNANQTAVFGNSIWTPSTVVVDEPVTVNRIELVNLTHSYNVAGLASVNLVRSTNDAPVDPSMRVQGTHNFQVNVNLQNDTTVDVAIGSTLSFDNQLDLGGNTLTQTGDGVLLINNQLNKGGGSVNLTSGMAGGVGTVGGSLQNTGGIVAPGLDGGVANVVSQVPEPGTMLLMVVGGLMATGLYRRRGMRIDKILVLSVSVILMGSLNVSAQFFLPDDILQEAYTGNSQGDFNPPFSFPQGDWQFNTPGVGIATHDSIGGNLEMNLVKGDPGVPDIWTPTETVVFEIRAKVLQQSAGNGAFVMELRDNTANDIGFTVNLHDNGVYLDCENDCVNGSQFYAMDTTSDFHDYMMVYEPTTSFATLWVDRVDSGITIDQATAAPGGNSRGANQVIIGDNCGGCYRGITEVDSFRIGRSIHSTGGPAPTTFTWDGNGFGNWNIADNWSPVTGPPNDPNHTAVLGDSITAPATIVVDEPVTVNRIEFNNPTQSYGIAGLASVHLVSNTEVLPVAPSIVVQGSHQFQAKVNLHNDTTVDVATASTLGFNNQLALGGNTLTQTGDGVLLINHNIKTGGGGMVNLTNGTLGGGGTINGSLDNSAVVVPGNGPGILTVDGNYTQSSGGTLEIELASNGGVAGTDQDRLEVTLAASLNGTLNLQLDGGYTPTIGDSFEGLVNAGTLSGKFARANNVVIDGRRGIAVTYTDTAVDAQIGLRGNTDISSGDIDVDTGDLTVSIINFTSAGGTGKTWADGDMDGDGDVDTGDLTISIINFTSALSAGSAAVPEPTSVLLFCLGWLLLVVGQSRRAGR